MTAALGDTYEFLPTADDGWFDLPQLDGFFVYALFGTGGSEVLYIGQSTNVFGRIAAHLSQPEKREQVVRVAVRRCSSKQEMDEYEQLLIAAHCPPWNTVGLSRTEAAQRRAFAAAERAAAQRVAADAAQQQLRSTWLTSEGVADRADRSLYAVRRAAVSDELHGHQPIRNGQPLRKGKWTFHVAAVDAWVRGQDVRAQAIACGCVAVGTRHRRTV